MAEQIIVQRTQNKDRHTEGSTNQSFSLLTEINTTFSLLTSILITSFFRKKVECQTARTKSTHDKKLRNIGVHNDLKPCDPDKIVLNYSSVNLSFRIKTLLAFGLDFCLPIYKLFF